MAALFNKWLLAILVPFMIQAGDRESAKKQVPAALHPLHVSVTEINHNSEDRTLEISCKIFTDDFESVLTKNYKTKVDLINPPDQDAMDKLVSHFIRANLHIKADKQSLNLSYLGYERDNDAIYSYFQVEQLPSVKTLDISNTVMYDLFTDQINLMHVTVGGKRKSTKLDFPAKEAAFNF